MERLISRTTVSHRIHAPGRSPFLPLARRTASAAAGGGSAPWTAVRAQPARLVASASPLRHDGLSAAAPVEEVAAGGVGPPWKLLGRLLPKASTAALFLLMTLVTSVLHSNFPHPAYASVQPAIKSGGLSIELLSSGWAGFFAGCLHTLSGPDHLVALAPLSIGRSKLESGLVGALWGCGHDAGQIIFGLLFLLLKDRLHIEVLRIWGTRVVGLTLLLIGATGIREASEVQESGLVLEGVNSNISGGEPLQQAPAAPKKKKVGFTTFATGVVHGLQPDALLMVLPALAFPSRFAGAAYLGMFLVGTVFSMGSYTAFVGSCSEALKDRVPKITEKLTWAASLVAVCMGLALLVGQFFGFTLY